MKILCPNCGVKGSADDSYCDRKVKCPKCRTIFLVQAEMALDLHSDAFQPESLSATAHEAALESQSVMEERLDVTSGGEGGGQTDSETTEREEEFDWSQVAAEIDQQLQESDRDQSSPSETPDEMLGFVDDLTETLPADDQMSDLEEIDEGDPASLADDDDRIHEAEEGLALQSEDKDLATIVAGETEVEEEPYGLTKEQCWECGKEDSVGEPFIAKDGRLYCTACVPDGREGDGEFADTSSGEADQFGSDASDYQKSSGSEDRNRTTPYYKFSIIEALKEAWGRSKGAKATIWAGSAVMYLVILVFIAGGAFLLPSSGTEILGMTSLLSTVIFPVMIDIASVLFASGLLYIGIRKVVGDPISWKMIGKGFSCAGKIIIATVLQSVFVMLGFLLLVLPGIYLAVGYTMTLPLIVDKGLSPWKAMEKSRKAVHKVWWKVFGLFLAMGLVLLISLVPFGIGLIWTWPMFIVLAGVLYSYLFGSVKRSD